MARLLVLKQAKILDSDRNDIEYDRFVSLARRILHVSLSPTLSLTVQYRLILFYFYQVPYALVTFIDFDRQWVKSCSGLTVEFPNLERKHSVDATLMFPDSHELRVILSGEEEPLLLALANAMDFDHTKFGFYMGAVITVDGFKLGVLSVMDTKPHDHVSLDDRQNLLDLSAAVSNLVKERRLRNLQLKKQRANLMLGLNHNLRTPVS